MGSVVELTRYLICNPRLIRWILQHHEHYRRDKYDGHDDRGQEPPRHLPKQPRTIASHVVYVLRELLVPVDEDHGDHLHQRDHDESDRPGKRVEEFQPVLTGARRKDQPQDEAQQAHGTCELESGLNPPRREVESNTCHVLLPDPLEDLYVEDGAQHSLEDADLRTQPQREQHHEEDHGPEGGARKFDDGLGEDDEGETGAFGGLEISDEKLFGV